MAAIATVLQVSLDWLLGLTSAEKLGAAILRESVEVALSAPHLPSDENLERWHREAVGYKIRYVPATLPDFTKTESVLTYEYADYSAKKPAQAIAAAAGKLAYSRMPEADFEICCSRQVIAGFARGEGIWAGLDADARAEQLEYMAQLTDELYPRLRLFLFDGLAHYAVPYTVFGPKRAALFLGEMYFVFNTTEHVRMLTEHFDRLIRAAVVQAHEASAFLAGLATEARVVADGEAGGDAGRAAS